MIAPVLDQFEGLARLLLVVLCFLGLACSDAGTREKVEPRLGSNLLFISLDTTRPDHLGIYGYERDTSPTIDRLAESGAVFERAVAQMTITNPSHASMMTGLYPKTHGVGENTRKLPDEFETLAEALKARDYATAAFVSGHPLRKEITGLTQGFDHYDSDLKRRRWGRETTDRALEWLKQRDESDGPFFAFVHYYDSHGPFRPQAPFRDHFRAEGATGKTVGFVPQYQRLKDDDGAVIKDLAEYIDRYDEQILSQDSLIGELLEMVDLGNTVVVIVADHGETFDERGEAFNLNHGTGVFAEQIDIPMIIAGPEIPAGRHTQLAETVDLFPTLMDLLFGSLDGLPVFEGQSLAPVILQDETVAPPRTAFASNRSRARMYLSRGLELAKDDFIHTVRKEDYKLVRYPGVEGPIFELFDLAADPLERIDLASDLPEIGQDLGQILDGWNQRIESTPETDLSEDELRELEALGYVDG